MRRRAHLLATAALITALAPVVAGSGPVGEIVQRAHSVRDAVMGAGFRFHGLAEIITGVDIRNSLPL